MTIKKYVRYSMNVCSMYIIRTYFIMSSLWPTSVSYRESSPVALWDSIVSDGYALQNLAGSSSNSSGYVLVTILWILWIRTYYSLKYYFSPIVAYSHIDAVLLVNHWIMNPTNSFNNTEERNKWLSVIDSFT